VPDSIEVHVINRPGRPFLGTGEAAQGPAAAAIANAIRDATGISMRELFELQTAINRFLAETNEDPKPFTWTADPDKIIAAVRRGHQVLDSIH
jgi:hypothetical protein